MANTRGGDWAARAANLWRQVELRSLLSRAVIAVGAGNPTDAGVSWTLPTEAERPIVLGAGVPDPATMPVDDLRDALHHVLSTEAEEALSYGGVLGFSGLREALAQRQSRLDGLALEPENFLLNNGGAGSIDSVCRAFLEPGDAAIIEGPTFSGSARTFRGHLAEVAQAPLDEEGLLVGIASEAIKKAERAGRRVKLLYTVPDFHNPTGATLSLGRRYDLLELCAAHQVLILEDTAYTELYFNDPPPPSLYSLSQGEGVLKVGSFSKIIAPGLRVGWVQGRPDFIEALARVRYDMGVSPLLLRALAEHVGGGRLEAHLKGMRPIYAEKCETLSRSLQEHCAGYVRFRKPAGGFFLWVECLGPSAREIREAAALEGLVFPGGDSFYLRREQDDASHLRLAFSTASLEELAEVGPRLRAAFRRALGEG
ncbi:MAG: PLP-dependent aminotransferase family protein [Chloroflexi bacterium]|nr:PLP-dependent aminotransferase family protein [Chloroflexota bacterium]